MSDKERAAFANLMLFCSPHHDLVDDRRPEDYPVELLKQWKADRESEAVAIAGGALAELTEAELKRALEAAVGMLRPTRDIKLDVECGLLLNGVDMMVADFGTVASALYSNEHLRADAPRYIILTVRNVGTIRASLETVSIYHRFSTTPPLETKSVGANQVPEHNPRLPKALEVGDSTQWFVPVEAFVAVWILDQDDHRFRDFRFEVTLGSGEVLSSEWVDASHTRPWN